jgi:hypothetical protein
MHAPLQELLQVLRRKGWRVNLRFLAEVQLLFWMAVLALVSYGFYCLLSSEGGLFSYEGYEEDLQQQQQIIRQQQLRQQQQFRQQQQYQQQQEGW